MRHSPRVVTPAWAWAGTTWTWPSCWSSVMRWNSGKCGGLTEPQRVSAGGGGGGGTGASSPAPAVFLRLQTSPTKRPPSLSLALCGLGQSPVAIESCCTMCPLWSDTTILSRCMARGRRPSGLCLMSCVPQCHVLCHTTLCPASWGTRVAWGYDPVPAPCLLLWAAEAPVTACYSYLQASA